MFWERFTNECERVRKKPNPVAKELGISSGTITGWKNGAKPQIGALNKLAEYFGCTTDYLLGVSDTRTSNEETKNTFTLSEQEKTLITLFREASEEDRLIMITAFMNIKNGSQQHHRIYRAARSEDDTAPTVETRTTSDINKLKNAATVTSDDEI